MAPRKDKSDAVKRESLVRSFFSSLSGRTGADVSGSAGESKDLKAMLLAIGGPSSSTRSGVDLTTAAKKLGVTRRTLERNMVAYEAEHTTDPEQLAALPKERNKMSPTRLAQTAKKARQQATTRAGRREAVKKERQRLAQRSVRLAITGNQGPVGGGATYLRRRTVNTNELSPDQVDALFDAYEKSGADGAHAYLERLTGGESDAAILEGWKIDDVDSISFVGESRRLTPQEVATMRERRGRDLELQSSDGSRGDLDDLEVDDTAARRRSSRRPRTQPGADTWA